MSKRSAGVLLFRRVGGRLEVFLVHPGGPFWAKKDEGAWSIPKGEIDESESTEQAARREFFEETGVALSGNLQPLGAFRQASGKIVTAYASEADIDPAQIVSNKCVIEWPPKSGRSLEIPEIDRAAWFSPQDALIRVTKGQRSIIEALRVKLANST
jgi:predicted NUDIX family NTP pyrophosphohydrolase